MKKELGKLPKELQNLDWLETVFDFMNAGLVIVDMQKKDEPVIYANPKFYDMTGYEPKDIIGKNCRFLQGKDTDKKMIEEIRTAIKKKKRAKFILKNITKKGKQFWNELYLSPIFNEKGKNTHYIGIQHDVTEEMAYEL
jgi:PAS domain S-box-containing protein